MSSTDTQTRGEMSCNMIRQLAFGMLLLLPATAVAQQGARSAEQVAKAYGIDSFGQIEALRYTFNAELPNVKLSRTWEWSPKTDTVSFEGKDKEGKPLKVSYQRSQLAGQSDVIKKEIDPEFVNDQYWLLLPFHIVWDGATVTNEGTQKLPSSDASAERLVAKYPSEGGYQPGDTWELYVGADKRIEEMVYRRGAPTPPPKVVITTYGDYKQVGPLLISTDHRGTFDGKPLHLSLTDISVKLTGSDNWINAQ